MRTRPQGGEPQGEKSLTVRLVEARTGQSFQAAVKERRDRGMTYRQIGQEIGISGQSIWRHYRLTLTQARHATAP